MANFSTDQVRQLYVVTDKATVFDDTTVDGAIAVNFSNEDVWFTYQSPNAGLNEGSGPVRSDLIPVKCVEAAVATSAKSRPLRKLVVELDPTINGGNPVVGQEYILRYTFFGLGIGGNENQYIKNAGSYRVRPGDTATDVLQAIKDLSDKNFSREPSLYVTTTLVGTTLEIEEVPQKWVRGKRQAAQVNFEMNFAPILYNGTFLPWGTVTDATSTNTNVLTNGRVASDMEWFYYGERGDQFRFVGYPNNFESIYLTDPNKEYDFVDITYYFAGDTEDVQKSKKTITLAIPKDSAYAAAALVADITAAGVNVVDKL